MATLDQLSAALVKADAAGNVDDARAFAAEIRKMRAATTVKPEPRSRMDMLKDEALTSLPGGLLRGVKDVIDTGAGFLSKLGGAEEAARVQAENDAGKADFAAAQERAGAGGSNIARVGGQVLATLPVGGVLGAGAKALGATRLGNAMASGGFSTGVPAGAGFAAKAADMGIRMAGGGATGYAAAGLIDPESANVGGAVGALLPPVAKLAGAGGNALASMVRPFTSGGQERIAGNALRQFASDPAAAVSNLRRAAPVVDGSMPTAVMAAGDEGLAGLNRTLQSADPRYAAELSSRAASQNAARTTALEGIAGNTGKLTLAKEARDAATGPMREAVLDSAGKLPAASVLDSIDRLLAKPDNAGKLAQQALTSIKNQIAGKPGMHGGHRVGGFVDEAGQIDARALYAIRKDINDTLGGKLQGEAGNLKLASGQLVEVKALIDDAIDKASRAVQQSSSRAVMPAGANIERAGVAGPFGSLSPRPSWKQYLQEYTRQSIPINQMEKLDEVLNAARTGTVDQSGNAVLSAAKLNNILRNQAQDLKKVLSPEQLETLRKVAADLNASQLANNAGKAVGSNTVQNLAGTNVLASLMGDKLAGSTSAQSMLNRLLQLPYGTSNKMIQEKLGAALLDPAQAARLMADPQANKLIQTLGNSAQIGYRAAPAISANR
jgi:hypothetical protein